MSIAALQYDKFKEQVVAEGKVWTFTEQGEYLVFPVREGEAIPFWSSRSRLQKVCEYQSKYRQYDQSSMPLEKFIEWLPELKQQKIHIGANWSGERLSGYDVSPDDMLAGLRHYIDKQKGKAQPAGGANALRGAQPR